MNVAERVAVVTGGGGGIGGALVARLARAGARVVASDLDAETARAVSERVNADHPGSTVSAGADASDTAQIEQLIALAENTFGPVDLYFANAGIAGAPGLDWCRGGSNAARATSSAPPRRPGCSPRSAPPRTPSPSTRP
ncbi:SDR family NAD(P)-dependent oxidoreductase [Streptomyces sp. NPDC088760]|uniref:SDR family NAD(P)-dependent oxidoreductase n=1 Tax=Streptomyces sp. NPDC088760 TaxID=3365890 RepID=UPI00380E27C6